MSDARLAKSELFPTEGAVSAYPVVSLFASRQPNFLYRELGQWLRAERAERFRLVSSMGEFFTQFEPDAKHLILVSVSSREEVAPIESFIDELERRDAQWGVQVVVVTSLDYPSIWASLIRRNCTVIAQQLTTLKTLKLKVDRQLALLELSAKRKSSGELKRLPVKLTWGMPLMIEQDLWVIPPERFARLNERSWVLSLMGPPKGAGRWEATEVGGGETWWRWVPVQVPDGAVAPSGFWYFRGKRPRCQLNRWIFISSTPELIFVRGREARFVKIRAQSPQDLHVAPNSPYAIQMLPLIAMAEQASSVESAIASGREQASVFHPIDDVMLLREFLGEAVSLKLSVLLWEKGHHERSVAQVVEVHPNLTCIVLRVSKISQGTEGGGVDVRSHLGSFNIERGSLFFQSNRLEWSSDLSHVAIYPDRVFFCVQRRRDIRVRVNQETPLSVRLSGVEVAVTSLSVSGLGLMVPMAVMPVATAGKKISFEMVLGRNQPPLSCQGEIRWSRSVNHDGALLVQLGIKFEDLTAASRQRVQTQVFELEFENL